MKFPKNATSKERDIDWQLIAKIQDSDFNFDTPKEKMDITKFCVRVLLFNEKREICVIKSEKYGYTQLPGGGIDKGESILDGLKRETREETGFLIKDIEPLGFVIENRNDIQNTHDFDQVISYVFSAMTEKYIGTNFMEYEIAEDFEPIWMKFEDFVAEKENSKKELKNYSGCFSNRRDLEILNYYHKKANVSGEK